MIIFLYGSDSFRIHERAHVLERGFLAKFSKDNSSVQHQVQWLDGASLQPDDIHANLLTKGLFATKQFLVLRNIFTASDKTQAALLAALPRVSTDTIVVCTSPELPKTATPLSEALLHVERVEEYQALNDQQVMQWIREHSKANAISIQPEAVSYLVQAAGNDLWQLHNAIQQLSAYCAASGSTAATLADVQLFVDSPIDDNIFHFTDAIIEKNSQRAIKLLHDQLSSGAQPLYLLSMLARQIHTLIQIKETNGKGLSLHPYVVKKTLPFAQRSNLDTLKQLYQQIVDIDVQFKSVRTNPELLLEHFVIAATS